MKIAFFLLTITVLQISASVYSQDSRFNLNIKGETMEEALSVIESNSQYKFLYRNELIDINKQVDLKVKNADIDLVLEKLFISKGIIYRIFDDNLIVLTKSKDTQEISVKGKVTGNDGTPLPGVNVVEKGTTRGAVTDLDGNYTIDVSSPDAILVFSFIGYLTEEVGVGGRSSVDIALMEDIKSLEEVVVIGYGSLKKSDISGSVATVSSEDMMKKSPTNILQGLQGVAAGVMVTSQDGAPDANAAIRIRGVATINGSADPLYVVDGVQVGTNANFLNPHDVENVEILKDASATAIYGAAGANGVIMITTKKGKVGSPHITFSADYGVQTLASTLDVGDIDQYAENIRVGRVNDGANIANEIFSEEYDGRRNNIDWQDEMTRVSLKQQYNLSASGGTENTQHRFSLSYLDNDGIVINTNYNRLTGRANVVTKVADFIEVGGDVNFVHTETRGSNLAFGNNGNLSSLRDFAFFCPTMDYVDPTTDEFVSPNVVNSNGTYGTFLQSSVGSYDGNPSDNLYATQMENNGITKTNRVLLSGYASIKLFKGLTFKTIASYNLYAKNYRNFSGNKKRYMPDGVTEVELTNYDDRYKLQIDNSQSNDLAIESYLTYNWKNQAHNFTIMAGNSISKSFGDWVTAEATDFPGDNIRDIGLTSDLTTKTGDGAYNLEVRGISYFGRAVYSLMDRYIVTGTIRRDGSSNFGAGNRWGTFPSAAAAWRISEESFMQGIPVITNLKLRLGWGQTGNSGGPTDKSVAALSSESIAYYFYSQDGIAGLGSTRQTANGYVSPLVDINLKWETNEQSNIGIDLGLFNNVNLTVDYFVRTSKDLLLEQSIRPSAGYTSVYTNYGEIENEGVEFSINYSKQLNNNWFFGATFTGSSLKNKVIKMGADLLSVNGDATDDGSNIGAVASSSGVHWDGHSICREGYEVGSFYGYVVEGVFQSQAEVDAANAAAVAAGHSQYQNANTGPGDFKYKDIDGDGFIDENDMTILGHGFPKLNFGLTLNTSYKNWDMSVYTYGVLGQDIYSYSTMTLSNIYPGDNQTIPNILKESSEQAWTPENGSNSLSKLTILDYNYNMRGSDAWVKKGDFLKINTVQIGYNFGKNLLSPLRLDALRLNVSVQNLFTISSYNKYGDPEAGQGSVLFTGLDTGRYPMPRIYSFGINLQF